MPDEIKEATMKYEEVIRNYCYFVTRQELIAISRKMQ